MTAVRHANGKDWWIITSKFDSNKYYRFLIDSSGIQLAGFQHVGKLIETGLGQSVFSPDGNWYARYNAYGIVPITDKI